MFMNYRVMKIVKTRFIHMIHSFFLHLSYWKHWKHVQFDSPNLKIHQVDVNSTFIENSFQFR